MSNLPEKPKCDCGLNPHAIYCAKNQPLEHSKYSSKLEEILSMPLIASVVDGERVAIPKKYLKFVTKLEAYINKEKAKAELVGRSQEISDAVNGIEPTDPATVEYLLNRAKEIKAQLASEVTNE